MKALVHFERVGRTHDLDAEFEVSSLDDLAEQIFRFSRKHLGSRWFGVSLGVDADETTGDGCIEAGRFGRFTFTLVPEAAA